MGKLSMVRLSVFVNYHIDVKQENTSKLVEELNGLGEFEFLPNIIPVQSMDLDGRVVTESFYSFITRTQSCRVVCMDERIDCILYFNSEVWNTVEDGLEFCNSVLTVFMEKFPVLGNRLAINIQELGHPIPEELLETKTGQPDISVLDFYRDKRIEDWSTRVNARIPIDISEKAEMLNVITKLGIPKNKQTGERRMLCHFDINTIPENQEYRFSKNDVSSFLYGTKEIIDNLRNNFERLNYCE